MRNIPDEERHREVEVSVTFNVFGRWATVDKAVDRMRRVLELAFGQNVKTVITSPTPPDVDQMHLELEA